MQLGSYVRSPSIIRTDGQPLSRAKETPLSDEMMKIPPDVLNRFPLNEVMTLTMALGCFFFPANRIIHLLNLLQWAIAAGLIVLGHTKTAL